MVFREESEVRGVPTYRFRPPDSKKIFEGKDFCFCPNGKNNACYKQGVLSMAPCRDGKGKKINANYNETNSADKANNDMMHALLQVLQLPCRQYIFWMRMNPT